MITWIILKAAEDLSTGTRVAIRRNQTQSDAIMITWIILKAAEDLSTGTRVAPSDAYLMREAIRRHQSEEGAIRRHQKQGPKRSRT